MALMYYSKQDGKKYGTGRIMLYRLSKEEDEAIRYSRLEGEWLAYGVVSCIGILDW